MRWERIEYPDVRYAATVVGDTLEYMQVKEYVAQAVSWCRNNGIFHWNSNFTLIRFTSEKDLTLFLLRFG